MDLDTAYLDSAMPEPVVLLHQNLKPYSLGHDMLLRRHRSPFVTLERMPEIEDLYMAVYLCACDFEEAQRELSLPGNVFAQRMADWQAIVVRENKGPLRESQVLELVLDFQKYVRDGSQSPKFNPIGNGNPRRKPGAPLLALMLRTLTREYHFTKSEALNLPFGWAMWLYLTHSEQEQRVRLVTQQDEDSDALIRAEMKKRGWEPMRIVREGG